MGEAAWRWELKPCRRSARRSDEPSGRWPFRWRTGHEGTNIARDARVATRRATESRERARRPRRCRHARHEARYSHARARARLAEACVRACERGSTRGRAYAVHECMSERACMRAYVRECMSAYVRARESGGGRTGPPTRVS